ncbi:MULTISPECIES: AMP-binding protein [Streptomyces]|uniref:AMP-binding protein n=1 Tax=Streptomyces TaxID=1883 RepID=UPI00031DA82D|nr:MULTISPECIES: AMP-binding protein [Streptomyces]QKV68660.1 AMP-binding protein [Streptomyces harbinensis]
MSTSPEPAVPLPTTVTLLDGLFTYAAERHPAQLIGSTDPARALPFARLEHDGVAVAAALLERGVRRGTPVVFPAGDAADFFPVLNAIVSVGAIAVPVSARAGRNPASAARLRHIVEDCEAALILADDDAVPVLREVLPDVPTHPLSALLAAARTTGVPATAPPGLRPADRDPEDLALIQYTSGSTSRPRGVALTHRNVLAALRIIPAALRPHATDVISHWLPLSHDLGLFGTLASLGCGIRICLSQPRDFIKQPDAWLAASCEAGATILVGPDFFYQYLVEAVPADEVTRYDLSGVRMALNGAEPIDPAGLDLFARHFAPAGFRREAQLPCYGLAEATLPVSFDSPLRPPAVDWVDRAALNDALKAVPAGTGGRGIVNCGTPAPGVEVRVTAEGETLPERSVGEIEIRGEAVTAGYYRESEPSARPGGWRGTGDLGYFADGCLHITGRSKEILILAGQNHYPQDIEDAVREAPGLFRRSAVAVVLPADPGAGLPERIGVFAEVASEGPHTATVTAIRRTAAEVLGGASVDVVLLPALGISRTTSGKFQRLLMRKRLLDGTLDNALAHITAAEVLTAPGTGPGGAPSHG